MFPNAVCVRARTWKGVVHFVFFMRICNAVCVRALSTGGHGR